MKIKPGVDVSKLSPQGLLILVVAQQLRPSVRVTSGNDGKHMPTSKHYVGDAVDLGSKEFDRDDNEEFCRALRGNLGADFDVIYEKVGTPDEHIHVEYDRKAGR